MGNVSFKITVEYICYNMISEKELNEIYNGNVVAAYSFISNNFDDSPENFATDCTITKIEKL